MKTVALLCMVLVLRSSVWAQHKTTARATTTASITSPQELFRRLSPSVLAVQILDTNDSVVGIGSGIVVGPNLVVTNRHVIDFGRIWRVKRGDKTWRAFVTWVDPDHDLGLLKADGLNAPAVSLRFSPTVAVGERVYAIGTPEGLELTLSEGIVSGLREYENGYVIQTSAAISPGSSGGGLFDAQGGLLGITTFYLGEGQNLNFALPAEWVQSLLGVLSLRCSRVPFNQQESTKKYREVLDRAGIVESNLITFVPLRRLSHDRAYASPSGAFGGSGVSWLITDAIVFKCMADQKSPDCFSNWPLWQQASLHMLMLREEIRAAQPARDDLERGVLDAARSVWSDVADVYCQDRPGGLYTDLEGRIRACPNVHEAPPASGRKASKDR